MADAERRDEPTSGPRETGPEAIIRWKDGDFDPIADGMADVLVHRLFAIGLDLHAAMACVEAQIAEQTVAEKIHSAIDGLDDAIRDFRGVIFDLRPTGRPPPTSGSLRALIVEAVERACEPTGGACPAISFGGEIDTATDEATSQQLARLVHRVLALVPCDHRPIRGSRSPPRPGRSSSASTRPPRACRAPCPSSPRWAAGNWRSRPGRPLPHRPAYARRVQHSRRHALARAGRHRPVHAARRARMLSHDGVEPRPGAPTPPHRVHTFTFRGVGRYHRRPAAGPTVTLWS